MVSREVFQRRAPDTSGMYSRCEINQADREWQFIQSCFCAQRPHNRSIAQVFCIFNETQHRMFELGLSTAEAQTKNPVFDPKWKQGIPNPLREKVIERWLALTQPFSPCTIHGKKQKQIVNTKILSLWHGATESACRSICETGFTTFGKHAFFQGKKKDGQNTDIGFFGSGIYFTTSAQYAADIYSDGNLLLTWVSMREPYPVVADKAYPDKPSDMKMLEGQGAFENFNAHYIPVASIQPDDPSCGIFYPCTDTQTPVLDEIVVFASSQALPRFWVQLQPDLVEAPPMMISYSHLVEHLMKLLDVVENLEDLGLYQFLQNQIMVFLDYKLSDELAQDDLEFYGRAVKLIDQDGKVDITIRDELMPKKDTVELASPSPATPPTDEPVVSVAITYKNLLKLLLQLLDKPAVQQDLESHQKFKQKSTALIACDLGQPLNPEDEAFYNTAITHLSK